MNVAERVIFKFGGITALARALGHNNASTVQGWKQRGFVPARQQSAVLNAAKQNGILLNPEDFFSPLGTAEAQARPQAQSDAESTKALRPTGT